MTSRNISRLSRRGFLTALGGLGGAAAVYHGLVTLGLLRVPSAQAAIPDFGHGIGEGRRVLILGAGVAGLCSAWQLARAGFDVRVIEANNRVGGRSLTVRPGDSYQEVDGPRLTCAFDEGLYLNAGPGRIPHHHTTVLEYCRRLGVQMEPYIFLSRGNLLQSDAAFNGEPLPMGRIDADLRGQIAEMLSKVSDDAGLDAPLGAADRRTFREMLAQFGDLRRLPDGQQVYRGSWRAGYAVPPGAGRQPGVYWPHLHIDEILQSGLWDPQLFNELSHYWQSSLMQPVGGMDMIVRGFLDAEVPGGKRVRDLVTVSSPVAAVTNLPGGGVEVRHGDETSVGDFAISTMAPSLLAGIGNNFSQEYAEALRGMVDVAACKVGWQAKRRFWETDHRIYGGISWTKHLISQIWYPSEGFLGDTGVLTGTYNSGTAAEAFGALPHEERLRTALEGGEKLHPGFSQEVYVERGLSIAWHKMPHFAGGWVSDIATGNQAAYNRLTLPEGAVYQAGDFLSYLSGWKEGALRSAHLATEAIVRRAVGTPALRRAG